MRLRWMEDQLRDPELLPLLQKRTAMPKGFRRGADGLLEKAVSPKDWIRVEWAPVVPAGQATATLAWRKLMYLHHHIGVAGGHRSAGKTVILMEHNCFGPR